MGAPNLNSAFKALRKQGLVCKSGFMCCRGCASSALAASVAPGTPVCFFTKQDREALERRGSTYLSYGITGLDLDDGNYSVADRNRMVEVGKQIVAALDAAGCVAVWNGDPEVRILAWRDREAYRVHAMERLGMEAAEPSQEKRKST